MLRPVAQAVHVLQGNGTAGVFPRTVSELLWTSHDAVVGAHEDSIESKCAVALRDELLIQFGMFDGMLTPRSMEKQRAQLVPEHFWVACALDFYERLRHLDPSNAARAVAIPQDGGSAVDTAIRRGRRTARPTQADLEVYLQAAAGQVWDTVKRWAIEEKRRACRAPLAPATDESSDEEEIPAHAMRSSAAGDSTLAVPTAESDTEEEESALEVAVSKEIAEFQVSVVPEQHMQDTHA